MRELYTYRVSAIHEIDARVKVLFTLAFVLSLNLTPFRAWPAYIMFLVVVLSIAQVSHLGIRFVLTRSLLAVPFFLAAAPLIFTGPQPHQPLPFWTNEQLAYSPEGCARFVSIAIRSWISIQAAVILAATTRFPDFLVALRQLKVPRLFVAIIELMWRYLFVISDEVTGMLRARASRSAYALGSQRRGGTMLWRASVAGSMAGNVFLRSIERSDRVYAAMLSRGYTGEPLTNEPKSFSTDDVRVLILGLTLLALLWLLGILTGE